MFRKNHSPRGSYHLACAREALQTIQEQIETTRKHLCELQTADDGEIGYELDRLAELQIMTSYLELRLLDE